jgi:Holliday junction resolvase
MVHAHKPSSTEGVPGMERAGFAIVRVPGLGDISVPVDDIKAVSGELLTEQVEIEIAIRASK